LWIGAYFSKPDWNTQYYWWDKFPPFDRNVNYDIKKYPERWKKFVEFTHNQIDELMTDYGKVDILWLDGGWVRNKTDAEINADMNEVMDGVKPIRFAQSQDINMPLIAKNARMKQPKLIVVDRAVPGEQQNYLTPEQHIPENGLPYPWETCMTMANSWSYVPNDKYKPTNEIIEKLVDIVSKGGNYLLNIGPAPDGTFDDTAYARLKEIGAWMRANGEAIYGTRNYAFFGEGNVRYTQSKDGKTQYVFFFEQPVDKVSLTKLSLDKNCKLNMLGSETPLKWKQAGDAIEIAIPASTAKGGQHVWVMKVTRK
jgi:alpha-L-fucosidase